MKKRYWVSWWSGNYASEGCTKPPFQTWVSGSRDRDNANGGDELSLCAVVDTDNAASIEPVIARYYPDYDLRFVDERDHDWVPGDRFPDFKSETSLTGMAED
jgi:hypothetical protein